MRRRCARSIGSTTSPVLSIEVGGGERAVELPVRVDAARAAGLDEQVARPVGEERPQGGELAGPVDVDPQPPGVIDGVLAAARGAADGGRDQQLLAAVGVARGQREQVLEPRSPAGPAAGEEVVAALAGAQAQRAVAAPAGGELDEPVGLLVQNAQLQRPVTVRGQLAGEAAPVRESHSAAQPFIGRRRAGSCAAHGPVGGGHRGLLALGTGPGR